MELIKKENKKYLDIVKEFIYFYDQSLRRIKKEKGDIIKIGIMKSRIKNIKELKTKLEQELENGK
jgi:hypothetical protein